MPTKKSAYHHLVHSTYPEMRMVRLADLPEWEAAHLLAKNGDAPRFETNPWVQPPPLAHARVALITTAGLHRRGDRPFAAGSSDYRVIPGDTPAGELVMSHISVNYDRSGFQEDHNVALPIDRLNELAAEGVIASVAAFHYAFMGATHGKLLEPKARELAGLLKKDRVDAVLLTPV
jgi:D-proline reductase (dithiol) PrdB